MGGVRFPGVPARPTNGVAPYILRGRVTDDHGQSEAFSLLKGRIIN